MLLQVQMRLQVQIPAALKLRPKPSSEPKLPGTQLQMHTAPGGIGEPHGSV